MEEPGVETATEDLRPSELWENIGFHRPLAGFFYNLPFYILLLILGIAFLSIIYNVLYPFPESMGYRNAATVIFSLFFYSFDLGTANLLNRFIGETNVKDPKKMVQYIQYFIWYQMITGLIQTTSISIYALFFVPHSQLAYSVWIMLIFSTTQFPGFLGIFRGVLGTLQQYNKTAILNFISGELFQRVTEIIFVLLGRWYGIVNPAVGEIMGIAIGATIGFYVDDFIATAFSAIFFKRVMKDYGFSVKDCFRHDFDRELWTTCLWWGIKSGLPNFFWTLNGFISLNIWLIYVPQYTTFQALASFGGGIGSLMGWSLDLGGCISEAFFNDKKKLAKYYISQAWRYTGMIQCFMFSILLVLLLVLEPILRLFGLEYYLLGTLFVFPKMMRDIQQPYNNFAEGMTTGTGHINFQMIIDIYEALAAILSWFIFIVWLRIPQQYGIVSIAWLIPCAELPAIVSKIAISYAFINKRIMKLKISWYQSFIAPGLATLIIYVIGILYVNFFFTPVYNNIGGIIALVPTIIIFIIIMPFFVYFPLTGLLGAWDDSSIEILRKATKMSGMGKFLSLPMYKLIKIAVNHSRLHGRFSIDDSEALKEARDLMRIKNSNRDKSVKIA
ncbi:MAG: hypothetical protein ACTSUE_20685 [Promethearchaeota archaeon]